jgi:D-sedoheptulose 7-phosphate isomerase
VAIKDYFDAFWNVLSGISSAEIDDATAILEDAYHHDRTIYIIGNGQSAATASAFTLDLTKQTISANLQRRFRVISLTDNSAAITAWANDVSYDAIFTEQLKSLFREGDVLVSISVSGNSPSVVNACEWVRAQNGKIIALAGFEGGRMKPYADACIVVNSSNYGFVETAHIGILHYWVDLLRERFAR